MSEESLIVKLKGDTADLDKKLDRRSNKGLNELEENSSKSDRSLAETWQCSQRLRAGLFVESIKSSNCSRHSS